MNFGKAIEEMKAGKKVARPHIFRHWISTNITMP